jgi:predicted phosphoribosyltransferase
MIFRNRIHAARLLAGLLGEFRDRNALVLAIPRGAVPMGRALADALGADLDVVLVRKLRAPGQPELAIGAVDEDGELLLNEEARWVRAGAGYIAAERDRQLALIRDRRALYTPNRAPLSPTGRVTIVLDDGVATGATMIAALRATRRRVPSKLIAATAVMPLDTYERLEPEADRVVCLDRPEWFGAVGEFFEDFAEVGDAQVIEALTARPGTGPMLHLVR